MKESLKPAITHTFAFVVPETKTVPHLYPEAHDGVDEICRGTHERAVIDAERFNAKVAKKASGPWAVALG